MHRLYMERENPQVYTMPFYVGGIMPLINKLEIEKTKVVPFPLWKSALPGPFLSHE
jgi:hypothetical protein